MKRSNIVTHKIVKQAYTFSTGFRMLPSAEGCVCLLELDRCQVLAMTLKRVKNGMLADVYGRLVDKEVQGRN